MGSLPTADGTAPFPPETVQPGSEESLRLSEFLDGGPGCPLGEGPPGILPFGVGSDRQLPRSADPPPEGLGLEATDAVQRALLDEQSRALPEGERPI